MSHKFISNIKDRDVLGTRRDYLTLSLRQNSMSVMDDELIEEAIQEMDQPKIEIPPSRLEASLRSVKKADDEGYSVRVNRLKPSHKSLEENRQERALQNYNKKQEEWEKVTNRLAKKYGKDPSELIMEKSGIEYRARLEELALLDAAIPPSQRASSSAQWETTLRSTDDDGVRYVRTGGYWPYPLYCPVVDQKAKPLPVVGKPFEKSIRLRSSAGKRLQNSQYVQERYGQHIKKFNEAFYNPGDLVSELKLEGAPLDPQTGTALVPQGTKQNHIVSDEVREEDLEDLERDLDQFESRRGSNGPAFHLSTHSLIFECSPNTLAHDSVTLTNTGSCAFQYSWDHVPYVNDLQKKRASQKFHLASVAKGVILPNTTHKFLFSFKSDIGGIFTDKFKLVTVPSAHEEQGGSILSLRGITIADEEIEGKEDFQKAQAEKIRKIQSLKTITQIEYERRTQQENREETLQEEQVETILEAKSSSESIKEEELETQTIEDPLEKDTEDD